MNVGVLTGVGDGTGRELTVVGVGAGVGLGEGLDGVVPDCAVPEGVVPDCAVPEGAGDTGAEVIEAVDGADDNVLG